MVRTRGLAGSHLAAGLGALVAGVLGGAIALHGLFSPHGLYGVTQYDDGVYFGAALRLVHGALPYRDFTFVQPPGIAVLMAPIALLAHLFGTRGAMAIARVLTCALAGANAFGAAWLVRHRGLAATLTAGVALAIFPPAFFADHTLLLEPYLVGCCLLGANLVFRRGELASSRRIFLGGLALGLAGAVKLWAVVPAVVLLACLLGHDRRPPLRYLAGVAVGFLALCLPFFVLAPGAFVHDVFASQLARQTTSPRQPSVRLWGIVGLHGMSLHFTWKLHRAWGVALAAILGVVLLLGGVLPACWRRVGRVEVFALASAFGSVGLLFGPVEYFDHYAYFSGAFLALGLGSAVGYAAMTLTAALRRADPRAGGRLAGALGVVLLALAVIGVVRMVHDETAFDRSALRQDPVNWPALAAVIPSGSCVTSDDATLVIEADRFLAAAPGCPNVDDADGTWMAEDPGQPTGVQSAADAALVDTWRGWFARSEYVALRAPFSFRIPFTPALRRYFAAHFTRVGGGDIAVYERWGAPPGP